MYEELKLVFKYRITNKLSINLTRANYYMVISSSRGNIHIYIKLSVKLKYLGVYIDQNLLCGSQIIIIIIIIIN